MDEKSALKLKKRSINFAFCARDWIRTSTPFPAPPPQGGASTNFATRATGHLIMTDCKCKRIIFLEQF